MTNPQRGYVEIEVGGRTRQLRYSLNALAELQEELGLKSLNDLLAINLSSFRTLLAFLHRGLEAEEPGLTRAEVGAWQIEVAGAIEKVSQAFCLSIFGELEPPQKKPKARKGKAAPSTGRKPSAAPTENSASAPPSSGN